MNTDGMHGSPFNYMNWIYNQVNEKIDIQQDLGTAAAAAASAKACLSRKN